MIKREQIRIRDPYIYVDEQEQCYYLYGTTDHNLWSGPDAGAEDDAACGTRLPDVHINYSF